MNLIWLESTLERETNLVRVQFSLVHQNEGWIAVADGLPRRFDCWRNAMLHNICFLLQSGIASLFVFLSFTRSFCNTLPVNSASFITGWSGGTKSGFMWEYVLDYSLHIFAIYKFPLKIADFIGASLVRFFFFFIIIVKNSFAIVQFTCEARFWCENRLAKQSSIARNVCKLFLGVFSICPSLRLHSGTVLKFCVDVQHFSHLEISHQSTHISS